MFDVNSFGDGPGGPMISGKWINKKTGETIIIRDSIIDGDKMVLISNKGNIDFNIFSRDYIQASDEVYNESGQVVSTQPVKTAEVIETANQTPVYTPEENNLEVPINSPRTEQKSDIKNFELIDKIFKKTESKPVANLKIEWADFPHNELSMLVNYFDVELEDISRYIGKYLINDDLLQNALFDFLSKKLKDIK